jgi:TetR/AcrR family transcriptional repressor of nem operon
MTAHSLRSSKHDLILAKGAQVMSRRGYHGTGVQEIVQAAGVPKGSFYHYFASKEDFSLQALEFFYEPRLQRYAEALARRNLSPGQRVIGYYSEVIGHFARQEQIEYHCFIGTLSFEMAELSQPIGRCVEDILQRSTRILADCLQEARAAGELPEGQDCLALAEFIGNAWEGALMRMKVGGTVAPLNIFLDQLQRMLAPR